MTEIEDAVRDLTPEALQALEKTAKERLKIISEGIWVQYPKADEIIKILERISRQPRTIRMRGRMIVGPTGNGKTTTIQEFIERQKRESRYEGSPDYEYLYVEMPEVPSVKALYIEILSTCNIIPKYGTAEQHKHRVLETLRGLKVKILFIDEIHNLLSAQNERILTQCRNALKGLSNRLRIPIILIGTEDALNVIEGDPQVKNRYPPLRLNP